MKMIKMLPLVAILALTTCISQARTVETDQPTPAVGHAAGHKEAGKHVKKHQAACEFDHYAQDRAAIKELIGNWYVYRDAALWDDFRKVWHEDGQMVASWSQAGYEQFIKATQTGMDAGRSIYHLPGVSAVKVNGNRATSMTKMMIMQRDKVDGVLIDVFCLSRHFDFWEKRQGRWGLVLRESIYDKAWYNTVNPNEKLVIDEQLWNQFPKEYAALAYLQEKIGGKVKRGMPAGLKGPALDELYGRGDAWLSGKLDKPWNKK